MEEYSVPQMNGSAPNSPATGSQVSVFQNLAGQGAKAVDAALRLAGKQPVERFVNVPFELVTPENMGQYARP